jgi:O-glycosyl hydrolase
MISMSGVILSAAIVLAQPQGTTVDMVRSVERGEERFEALPTLTWESGAPPASALNIAIDPSKTYQSILGLGGSLEHATCQNLAKLTEAQRTEVIEKLVDPDKGIGMNLMRVCMGTSDFTGEAWYSYDDTPGNAPDPNLEHFSIEKDRAHVLPVILEAKRINPDLLFFASPWSPPAWMKSNQSLLGGRMREEFFGSYARYFVRFIQAYGKEGIPIHAVTPQNEPGFPNLAYPTCLWTAEEQRDFVRDHLGPALRAASVPTRIWCWDHNWNRLDFPRALFSDPEASQYVEGTGFHLYEGKPDAQTMLHTEYPTKDIYFTEGSVFGTSGAITIINILRNWARSYNAWVLMLDEHRKPNNGPHNASQTCIELMDDGSVVYHFDYYMMGHFMKYIPRDAVRVDSSQGDRLCNNVVFRRPDGSMVAVVANASPKNRKVALTLAGRYVQCELPGRSVATLTWQ